MKTIKSNIQKRLDRDFQIILYPMLIVMVLYNIFLKQIHFFIRNDSVPILLRTMFSASLQFGIAGLGISIVILYRRESMRDYGLKLKGLGKTLILSFLCFVPYLVVLYFLEGGLNYAPLSVMTSEDVLASGFPVNIIGMLITAIAWGFFEGFNYVVICEKLNQLYPNQYPFLNIGAIACAIICIVIHGFVGVSFSSIMEMLSVFIIIYGMLMVKSYTGNAWGCVAIFVFLWNAF